MKKRILSTILTVAMLLSLAVIPASASDEGGLSFSVISFTESSSGFQPGSVLTSASAGDKLALKVLLQNPTDEDFYVGAYDLGIKFDTNALEAYSFTAGRNTVGPVVNGGELMEPQSNVLDDVIRFSAAASDPILLQAKGGEYDSAVIVYLLFKVKTDVESCDSIFRFADDVTTEGSSWSKRITGFKNSAGTGEILSMPDVTFDASTSLAINGTTPELDKVELTGTTMDEYHTVTVKGGDTATQFIQASAISAKGNDISGKVTWSMSYPTGVTDAKGVTCDATGKVTIANNATAGTYTITATPKNGEVTGEAVSHEFTVAREEETAASITISGGVETLYLPGSVALREGEFTTTESGSVVQYWESQAFTATVKNQYGETTRAIPVEWTLVPTEGQTLGEQHRDNTTHDYCADVSCDHANCEKYTFINQTGLEISASGHLMLTSACPSAVLGTATIQAKAGDKTATKTVMVAKADSQTATVTFTTAPTDATVPADGAEDKTYNYAVEVKDQYGETVSDAAVAWSISPEVTGVSISQNGVLTVTNAAKAEILPTASFDDTFTITAASGGKSAETTVTVARETAQPTSVAIYKNDTKLSGTTDTVTIPTGDTPNTYTYTAKVLDQYGAVMNDKTADLMAVVAPEAGGASFANHTLTVPKTAVKDKTVILTASYMSLDGAIVTITLKDIDITEPTVTIKNAPTYGDSWSDIVSFTGGSASLNGTNVAGEFYLKTTGKPNAGEQNYEIYFKSNDEQYDVLAKSGSVTIAGKKLTITANDNTITYGEAPANNGVTYSGFISGESAETTGVLTGTLDYEYSYTQYGDVGSNYSIIPKGLSAANYEITFVSGALTVQAKPLAASMVDDIAAVTYTGQAQQPTVTVTDGTTTLTSGTDYTVAYSSNTNAGTGTATITGAGNYSGTVTEDFTINKKDITVATVTLADKTYNGGTDATVTGVTFNDLVEGDTLTKGTDFTATATYDSANASDTAAAKATVTLSSTTAANNYRLTNGTDFATSGKVSKATISMTLTAANATYTGLAYAGTLTPGATNTQSSTAVEVTPDYAYYMDQECTTMTTAANSGAAADGAAPKNVGTYYVKGSVAADTNTSAASATASFQITKAALTVTATDKTITYGDAPDNAGVSYSGFVNGETLETSDLTGLIDYTYSYQQYGNVGSNYTITPKGLTSNNYAITFAPGTLTVEQKEVGISWGDASFTYSGSAQAPAATATGAVNNDSVTVTVSGAQTNAGTDYTATATGLSSGNYKLPTSGLTKSFSIAKADLTGVSVAQSGTLTYNGRAQRATIRWSATAVGSNTAAITYSTASGGDYGALVPGFTAAGDDHTVYYKISAPNHNDATGSFRVTIGKRPLTVGPKSYTITVGSTIPAFELEWNGAAEGDTLALSAEPSFECLKADGTAADSDSMTAGTYTIRWLNADETTLTGDNAENYEFAKLSTGTLTIEERRSTYNGRPVSLIRPKNGSVSISPAEAKEGATVTITATPDSGYELESLTATDAEGRRVTLKRVGEGKYTFTMPDSAVTIRASFGEYAETPFVDVPADKYFYDAVMWAVENGITGGVDATHFAPYASCTRGHLVTFLWRAAGEPEATSSKGFSDVAAKRSCAEAVLWAAENGIVGGYDNGTFRPDAAVTRQQAAAILWRFAKYAGMDVSVGEDTNILSYNDAFDVSEYAIAAIQWAVGEGIMQGNKGYLLPGDTCTRAQIVTFLFRACAEQ